MHRRYILLFLNPLRRLLIALAHYDNEQHKQHRRRNKRSYKQSVHLNRISRNTSRHSIDNNIIDSVTAHQHTMGVDTVWSAGDDSSLVLALVNRKFVQFFRQNDANLVYLISQYFIEHVHNENIAFHKLVKVCEKS